MANYYVTVFGNDGNNGLAPTSPKRNVLSALAAMIAAGGTNTLNIGQGTYAEYLRNTAFETTVPNNCTIQPYPNEEVWIKPVGTQGCVWLAEQSHDITFDGINFDASSSNGDGVVILDDFNSGNAYNIVVKNGKIIRGPSNGIGLWGHNCLVQRMEITGGNTTPQAFGTYGVYCNGLGNNIIEYCNIHNTSTAGCQIYHAFPNVPENNIFRYNIIHDITESDEPTGKIWGLILAGNNNKAYGNLFYNLTGAGVNDIILGFSGDSNEIYFNTLANNDGTGIHITASCSNTVVQNNIAYLNASSDYTDAGTATVQDHNLFGTDPLFSNPNSGDYHIPSTSPAAGAGIAVSGITTDLDGNALSDPPSIGCYDAGGTPPTSTVGATILNLGIQALSAPWYVDVVQNIYAQGTTQPDGTYAVIARANNYPSPAVYIDGNALDGDINLYVNELSVNPLSSAPIIGEANLTVRGVSGLEDYLVDNVGAWISDRDTVDTRLVDDLINRTGEPISSQTEVGGFPSIAVNASVFVPVSNPHVPTSNGYTNLEVQLYNLKIEAEDGSGSSGGGGSGSGGGTGGGGGSGGGGTGGGGSTNPQPPPNLTPQTALPITLNPFAGTQNVHDLVTNVAYTVWYKYTETQADSVLDFRFWGIVGGSNLTDYRPITSVYVDNGDIDNLDFIGQTVRNVGGQIPIRLNKTYYFQISRNVADVDPAVLNIYFNRVADAGPILGNVFIRTASIDNNQISAGLTGLPGGFIDATTETIRGFVPFLETGESGDILPVTGRMLFFDEFGSVNGFVDTSASFPLGGYYGYFHNPDFSVRNVVAVPGHGLGAPHTRTCTGLNRIYILSPGVGLNLATLQYVDQEGVLSDPVILSDVGGNSFAVSNDGTILYVAGVGGSIINSNIKRWDLVNNIYLTDLAPVETDHRVTDILVLADETIVALYFKPTTTRSVIIKRYAPDGTVLNTNTLSFAGTHTSINPRLGYAGDNPISYWFLGHWESATEGNNDVRRYRAVDDTLLVQSITPNSDSVFFDVADEPFPITSDSCPIIELVLTTPPGGGGGGGGGGGSVPVVLSGIYTLVPGKVNDTLWTDFTTNQTLVVRIPRPFGKMYYIGDD